MTPFITMQPAFDRADLRCAEVQATQLERTALPADAPWLYSALAQLHDAERYGDIVPGVGDLRLGAETGRCARMLLAHISHREDLPSPTVSPFGGGGVAIRWDHGDRELGFSIFPEGAIAYSQVDQEVVVEDGLLTGVHSANRLISWLMGR